MSDERSGGTFLPALSTMDGGGGAPRTNFLPATFSEAMDMSRLMAAGNFVPKHLRGKPGDCLAVVMQSARWGMDPFAVGNKTYFVNDRMAYEAQLVAAVVNTSGMLVGRLDVTWRGEGEDMICTVRGNIKGDTREKAIEQILRTIRTRNSPLWAQSPQMQLGYYTQRLWARLFTPEVLLGVYTVDEVAAIGPDNARQVAGNERRAPTRENVAERVISADPPVEQREHYDTETGEVESEEDIQRRLDAEQERQANGMDGDEQDDDVLDDTVPHMGGGQVVADPPKVEKAPEPKPEPVAEKVAEKAPDAAPVAIDWESWLTKFDKDLDKVDNIEDANKLYESKHTKLKSAPDGIQNRARGYHAARLRKLAPPTTTTKPAEPAEPAKPKTAARRTAAVADQIEQKQEEVAPAVEATAADPVADDVHPATKKADALIADFGRKETIIDLRNAKAAADPDIDAMDDENAERVTRAFRAIEDRMKGSRR